MCQAAWRYCQLKQTDETIGSTNEKFSDFDTYIKKLSNDLSSLKGSEAYMLPLRHILRTAITI